MTTRNETSRTIRRTRALRWTTSVMLGAALALAAGGRERGAQALAAVPTTAPTFTSPTTITNTYFPFVPGAVKVLRGRSDAERANDVDVFTSATREFTLGTAKVTCRMLEEYAFSNGQLVEISRNYFAQADDGSVYYFGETVDNYENGVIVDHGGSWLVGGPSGNDPPETETIAVPGLFMPANPEVGDEFLPEDLAGGAKEIDTIRRVGRTVRTPSGKFAGCIEVREFSPLKRETETKWYAPRVGVIKTVGKGEFTVLDSTSIR